MERERNSGPYSRQLPGLHFAPSGLRLLARKAEMLENNDRRRLFLIYNRGLSFISNLYATT
jgi:hypothetical protein